MKLTSDKYWKLRAKITEAMILEERSQKLIGQSTFIKNSALMEAGLDQNKNYNMDDENFEVTEINNEVVRS